jgi:heterodisulfide reductase subunit C
VDKEDREKDRVGQEDMDREFSGQVASRPGGEALRKCYTCGTCTASCPVAAVDLSFDPRKVIRMILLGMKKEVFESDFMWLCAGCHACTDRCPQGVRVSEIMVIVRNMAAEQGVIHRSYELQIAELRKYGKLYETEPYNKKRAKISLPPLKDEAEPVIKVMARTGLDRFSGEDKT